MKKLFLIAVIVGLSFSAVNGILPEKVVVV
jgi:hypothetical protein